MAPLLLPCPRCGCFAKPAEVDCPHCGGRLRRRDGSLPRAAAAVLLGLTAVLPGAMEGCGGKVVVDAPSGGTEATGGGQGGQGSTSDTGQGGLGQGGAILVGVGGSFAVSSSSAATASSGQTSTSSGQPVYGIAGVDAGSDAPSF